MLASPSAHEGSHAPPWQIPDAQSDPEAHPPPAEHGEHCAPPQSMPVSTPFSAPSEHVASQTPATHDAPAQSALLEQGEPTPHFKGQAAPQSTPVSRPFFAPSSHEGGWQSAPSHTPLTQSLGAAHPAKSGHAAAHRGPPQSTSPSPPFFTESKHVGAEHARASQTRLSQCSPDVHSTHAPAPSQARPPPSSHAAPIGSLSTPHAPSKHRGLPQSPCALPGSAQSSSITHAVLPPVAPPELAADGVVSTSHAPKTSTRTSKTRAGGVGERPSRA
jgi:hypothetical protein